MKRICALFSAVMLALTLLAGCTKLAENTPSAVPAVSSEPVASEEIIIPAEPEPDPLYINPFTGLRTLKESAVGNRPYGLMINNIREALPQWGISSPDMCYEFQVEGGITRILALFADPTEIPKIGPIRSARTYYVSTVCGYDAIYAHFGSSKTGGKLIEKLGINDLDGMYLSSTFVKDAERRKIRAVEHTYYTDSEKLLNATAKKKFRTKSRIENFSAFTFTGENEDITVNGETSAATDVKLKFSPYTDSEFKYNADDKLYYKEEFGKPHTDANNGAQIAVKNLIIIKDNFAYEADNNICLIFDQRGGKGWYCSEGKAIEIRWSKGEHANQYTYSLPDGTPLKVTPGKTWVSVMRNSKTNCKVEIS